MATSLPVNCDRTRAWVSAEVDGTLSDFESSLLRAHVGHCEACRSFRVDIAAFTHALRTAPLEESDLQVVVRRRRRTLAQPLRVTAAALAVAAVGLGTMFASLDARGLFGGTSTPAASAADTALFRQVRHAAIATDQIRGPRYQRVTAFAQQRRRVGIHRSSGPQTM
jgi:predicted anti-sigma-YlaC factor YlaD